MTGAIKIFDTTLRDGEQSPGCSMTKPEKLEVAKQLERLRVDVIEAGFAIASRGDFESIQVVAENVTECTIAALARAREEDIDAAWQAVRKSRSPRVHIFLATSPIHMKYKLKKTEEEVLEQAERAVRYARNLCPDVEFSAEDATRSEPRFLFQVLEAVIRAGAAVINVPDTVGYTTPQEYSALVKDILARVEGMDRVLLSAHCHNDLGLATANTLAAALAGAGQLECTINGIGERAGNAALEEVVMAVHTRPNLFGRTCRIDTTQLHRTSKLVSTVIGVPVPPNKSIVGSNAFSHEAGIHQHGVLSEKSTYEIMRPETIGLAENNIVLGKHSGRHAFDEKIKKMGYALTPQELDRAFQQFKDLADKKKTVSGLDIEALVQEKLMRVPEVFKLERYIINSGTTITATANVKIGGNGQSREEVASGDGPMDAAFNAIEKIVGQAFLLKDYAVRSVTGGKDAQGEVTVKIAKDGVTATGRGLSTDILEAGILAYINAVNKIVHLSRFDASETRGLT